MTSTQAPVWHDELRALWKLAVPLMLVQVGHQFMGLVDTAVVGRLSASELAAVGLGNIVFYAVFVLGQGIVLGVDPFVSQAYGAGKIAVCRQMLWQAVWLALVSAAGVMMLVWCTPGLFPLFSVPEEVAADASTYLGIRSLSALPLLLFVACQCYLQAQSRTAVLVGAMAGANVFNLGATVVMVHGGEVLPAWCGPLTRIPGYGVDGSAMATVGSSVCMCAIVCVAVARTRVPGWQSAMRRFSWARTKGALGVGVPVGLQMLAEVGVFALAGLLAGNIGAVALAAHQVAITLTSLTFTICIGLGHAGSVRVGYNIGRDLPLRARAAGGVAFGSALGIMSVPLVLFLSVPEALARLVTDQEGVVIATAALLGVAAVFQLTDGVQAVGAGVLRGAGDTRVSFVANLLGHYGIGLPVGVFCAFSLQMGVVGLWWGLAAGLSAVGVVLVGRFFWLSGRAIKAL